MGTRFLKSFIVIAVLGLFAVPSMANAKSMDSLVQEGFKISKVTRGKSGQLGWYATKGDQKYFCPIKTASAYIDSKRMYKFTSSGDAIEINRKVFDDYIGGPDPNIPMWQDLQVGKVKPGDVNPCLPSK